MDKNCQNRWLEVQFYYICQDIYNIRNDFMDIVYFVEALSNVGRFKIQKLKALAGEVIGNIENQPTREELILLMRKNGCSLNRIKIETGAAIPTINAIIKKDKENPRAFYCRLTPEDYIELQKFIDLLNKVRKVGIRWT